MGHNSADSLEVVCKNNPNALGVIKCEWACWLSGALLSFLLASVLMSGWPNGIIPNIEYPYIYAGDGLSHSWLIQRSLEGWIFENKRNGYPFGSNFLDYPGADFGNILFGKIFGYLGGGWVAGFNLYFLASFPLIFVSTYIALRMFRLGKVVSFSGSLLFSFAPFHIGRIVEFGHLFYAWYFVVPVFFYLSFCLFQGESAIKIPGGGLIKTLGGVLVCLLLGSFGIYYAFFGLICLAAGMLAGFIATGRRGVLIEGSTLCFLVVAGVLLNVAPNIAYQRSHGRNPEVARRLPSESEIFALKLRQLVLPRHDHRIKKMAAITARFGPGALFGYYEGTASLGIIGGASFLALGGVILFCLTGREVGRNLRFASFLTWLLFLFGTIGGLGALFSCFVTPSIRGWDRISIFIHFGAILGAGAFLQYLLNKVPKSRVQIGAVYCLVMVATAFGVYEQNVPLREMRRIARTAYLDDKDFYGALEGMLPGGSAVYQLPYMAFPEEPNLYNLGCYEIAAGFLNSGRLKWSWGGMRGRDGDLFYRQLSKEKIERQIEVARSLGFSGICIYRRGFPDNGDGLINEVSRVLGSGPVAARRDGLVVFFQL